MCPRNLTSFSSLQTTSAMANWASTVAASSVALPAAHRQARQRRHAAAQLQRRGAMHTLAVRAYDGPLLNPLRHVRSSTRLVFRQISFFRRRISWASSSTTMSTGHSLVLKAAPSCLAFRGHCGFRNHSLQSPSVRSSEPSPEKSCQLNWPMQHPLPQIFFLKTAFMT